MGRIDQDRLRESNNTNASFSVLGHVFKSSFGLRPYVHGSNGCPQYPMKHISRLLFLVAWVIITLTSQWPQWRLKSPALELFTQPFIQTQIKENIKAPRHWPLCGEFTGTGEFPVRRASYAENVSIWWRHHDTWCPKTLGGCRSFRYLTHLISGNGYATRQKRCNNNTWILSWIGR